MSSNRYGKFSDSEVFDRAVGALSTRYNLFEKDQSDRVVKAAHTLAEIAQELGVKPSELTASDLGVDPSDYEVTKAVILKRAVGRKW